VHAASEIEPELDRNSANGGIAHLSGLRVVRSLLDGTWHEREHARGHEGEDDDHSPLDGFHVDGSPAFRPFAGQAASQDASGSAVGRRRIVQGAPNGATGLRERRWCAGGRESGRRRGWRRPTRHCDVADPDNSREVESSVRRRDERGRRTTLGDVRSRQSLAERDGLRCGLRARFATPDSQLPGRTGDAEQRELQGSVGEPGEQKVSGAEHHGPQGTLREIS
jgi:hypothetical protein